MGTTVVSELPAKIEISDETAESFQLRSCVKREVACESTLLNVNYQQSSPKDP